MNSTKFIQLELDFSVLKTRAKVQVNGYDCYQFINLTGTVGVVDSYCQTTGNYLIYFKGKPGIVPNSLLILPYRREQLKVIPGRGRCSWEKLVKKDRK